MTMYLEHFGLREAPFRITPHTEFFFAGANRGATLEALIYAITAGEGLVKVTGEVGSGKTMLCRVLMERLPQTVETIYLAVPSLTRDEMLAAIAGDLGIDTAGATTTKILRALQERLITIHVEGKQVVALIDEAHAMPLGTLEEIRLLSNLETNKEKLLQVVLFGQPELDVHLNLPNMRQLKERITHAFTLAPLPPRDVNDYVNFRLRAAGYHGPALFGPEALAIIAEASEGLTRRINIYADKTLLAAFASGTHTVTADHARAAVSDTQIVVTPRSSRRPVVLAGALGVAAGIVIGYFAGPVFAPTPAPAPMAAPATAQAISPAAASATTPAVAPAKEAAPGPAIAPQAATAPDSASASAPAFAPATPPAEAAREVATAPAAPADPIEARLAAGRELLAGSARYGVQLMVTDAREKAYLEGYLAAARRSLPGNAIFLFPATGGDSPRVGVIFGAFEERAQANAALAALPENLRQFRPYVRALDVVREESRRAERR